VGLILYPSFEREVPGAEPRTTGEFLAVEFQLLDSIAESNGIVPLIQFGDNREVPQDFDGSPDELEELLGPWDEWFDSSEGLRAIKALVDLIRNPKIAKRLQHPEAVLVELEDVARILSIAAEQKIRFRLELR
jgi:hypothetical protein